MIRLPVLIIVLGIFAAAYPQEPTRWRGPSANGIYNESGLLKSWPIGGPEVLWSYEELGKGHSSPVVSDGFLYTSGMIGETGILFKFSLEGELIWKKPYGPEYNASYAGSRGTPVLAGDKIYQLSGKGQLFCLDAGEGSILWVVDLFKDFDGRSTTWGMNETPVVEGDLIYTTPGGRNNNVLALNRHSGEMVWSSKGKGELSAYCTPLLVEHEGRKILVTHTASNLIGLDALTGTMLWSVKQPNDYSVHANTPLYYKGAIFYFSGYGRGGGLLKLSRDGSAVSQSWEAPKLDSRLGGAVVVDGYIYSSGDYAREWRCVEWETGREMYASSELGKGVVIYADGMLYCYSDRGDLALVSADPSGFKIVSRTRVLKGSEQHWAHPIIHQGVLYVRHGSALIAYKIK